MRKLLFIFCALLLITCNEEKKQLELTPTKEFQLDKDFYKQTNALQQNKNKLYADKISEEVSKEYAAKMKQKDYISDYPLFYENGLKSTDGKYWVKFVSLPASPLVKEYKNYNFYHIELIGKVDENVAINLQEGTPYSIKGNLKELGWDGDESYHKGKTFFNNRQINFEIATYNIESIDKL